jgi:hypothetical protein
MIPKDEAAALAFKHANRLFGYPHIRSRATDARRLSAAGGSLADQIL